MVHFVYCLSSLYFLIFHYYIILNYYINLRSSIIFCLCSGNIYFSLCISLSCSIFFSELFCGAVFENFVTVSAILFPIKSPVASAVF